MRFIIYILLLLTATSVFATKPMVFVSGEIINDTDVSWDQGQFAFYGSQTGSGHYADEIKLMLDRDLIGAKGTFSIVLPVGGSQGIMIFFDYTLENPGYCSFKITNQDANHTDIEYLGMGNKSKYTCSLKPDAKTGIAQIIITNNKAD